MPKINRTHNTQLQWHFSYHSDWNIGPTNRSTFIELAKRWAQHKNVVRKIGLSEFFRKWMCVWALVVTRARLSLIPYKIESEKPNNQSTKWTGKHCNFCLLSQYKPWPISVFLFFYTFHTFQHQQKTSEKNRNVYFFLTDILRLPSNFSRMSDDNGVFGVGKRLFCANSL